MSEGLAKVIFWAAWQLYPPGEDNPVSRMTMEEAWMKANGEQRRLARFQAEKAIEYLATKDTR